MLDLYKNFWQNIKITLQNPINSDSDKNPKTIPTVNDIINAEKNNRKDPDTKKANKINKKILG